MPSSLIKKPHKPLFEVIGKEWVDGRCMSVERGGSGNIFANKFLEVKYHIVAPHYLEISNYKSSPLGQLFS